MLISSLFLPFSTDISEKDIKPTDYFCLLYLCPKEQKFNQIPLFQDRDPATITSNFFDFRPRFARYHMYFGFCEFLNLIAVLLSVVITDALLLNKFWG